MGPQRHVFALAVVLALAMCVGCGSISAARRSPLGHRKGKTPPAALEFPTADRGVLGIGRSVYLSTDRGQRWTRSLRLPSPVTGLSFAGSSFGWVLDGRDLFGTTDGGRIWSRRSEPGDGALTAVQLVTARIGYGAVCGQAGGSLLRTDDGGRSWRRLAAPAPSHLRGCQPWSAPGGVCFATPRRGWALTRERMGREIVLRTTDGGRTWRPSLRVLRAYQGGFIGCSGASAWNLVTGSPGAGHAPFTAFVTTDAGKRWRAAISTGPEPPTARGLPPARNGAEGAYPVALDVINRAGAALLTSCPACGDAQHPDGTLELQLSIDRGRHWTRGAASRGFIPLVAPFGTTAVSFPARTRGYLLAPVAPASSALQLLGSNDGGRTWRPLGCWPDRGRRSCRSTG